MQTLNTTIQTSPIKIIEKLILVIVFIKILFI